MGSSVLRCMKLASVLTLLLCSFNSIGATVGLLAEDNNLQIKRFLSNLKSARPSDQFKLYTLQTLPNTLTSTDPKVWLAMGAKPLGFLLGRLDGKASRDSRKILGLFIRPEAKKKLEELYPHSQFTLLNNTPPISRQLALIKVLSPQLKTVAILQSEKNRKDLSIAQLKANKLGLTLIEAKLDDPLDWNRESLKVLKDADVVLGITDSALYNATTIRSILMRLYRSSRPLIGPDKGYVKAGAVASTYSGVLETIQAVTELLEENALWPKVIQNNYFSVAVNAQVARSLNINVIDEKLLSKQVKEAINE